MAHESFGVWLGRQLAWREWTQADLARRSGISPSRIGDWLRGNRLPNTDNAEKLADALGVSIDEVLTVAGHRSEPVADPETEALVALLRRARPTPERHALLRALLQRMVDWDRHGGPPT